MTQERRSFNRVAFSTTATLQIEKTPVTCEIIDLSLHGALIKLLEPAPVKVGENYLLTLPLDKAEHVISMDLELTHQEENHIGLVCNNIDLESITHLRRLVELNLGDSQLLERDFSALCHQ